MSTSILVFDSVCRCVDSNAMALAENLKRIRQEKRLSQVRLAKLCGLSQQSISRLESGADQTSKYLPKIATALGVPVAALDPTYLSVISTENWTVDLTEAVKKAVEAGATLQQLTDVIDRAFHSSLVVMLQSRISELSPEQRQSVLEVAGKISGTEDTSNASDKRDN